MSIYVCVSNIYDAANENVTRQLRGTENRSGTDKTHGMKLFASRHRGVSY